MKSLRQALQKSWFPEMTIIRGDLSTALQISKPLSLTQLTQLVNKPEVRAFVRPLDADALHGRVEFIMRSDGTYTFRGHLRATGLPSFAYKLQAFVRSPTTGIVIAVEASGRVFGSDTSGERQRNWEESSTSPAIKQFWTALRSDAEFDTNLEKNLSGTLGALVDVAKTVVEVYVAAQFRGVIGAVIMLGIELGSAAGITFINPNVLAGITVGGGILVIFGPSAIIPALVAGTTTAALANIRSRRMNDLEIALAEKVFKGKLPIERIWITDLYNPSNNGIAREFVVPAIDGSILVNMGKNFEHTLEPDIQGRLTYAKPGAVFIHELTHAWQIHFSSFVPGMLCKALFNTNYNYDKDKVNAHAPWSKFYLEEQASIVNEWYGDNLNNDKGGLISSEALNDSRFFYIAQNIRLGHT